MARTSAGGRRSPLAPGLCVFGGLLLAASGAAGAAPVQDPAPALRKTALHDKSTADVAEVVRLIDDRLAAAWKENKLIPSDSATDHEFIRRASLDVIGRIPTPDEIEKYLQYPELTRRSRVIDDLLESDEYADRWAGLWADRLLGRTGVFGRGRYHDQMQMWLADQFAKNRRYDELVKELLTATGKNDENPAVNFILAHVGDALPADRRKDDGRHDMLPLTRRLPRLFLGVSAQCIECHDSPYNPDLKQGMFWGVTAFLRQVQRVGNVPTRRQDGLMTLELRDDEEVNEDASVMTTRRNGVSVRVRAAFFPSGKDDKGPALDRALKGLDRRKALAGFLLAHENFPRAEVNRLWGVFFGRGFTDAVDDLNGYGPPRCPELLNELAARFKKHGYDEKKLIRWICNSTAYGLSCKANATNDQAEAEALFCRMRMRPMSPEQLLRSTVVATGAEVGDRGKEQEWRKLPEDWRGRFVKAVEDCEGNEIDLGGGVNQALQLMNGDLVNAAVARKDKGVVARAVAAHADQPAAVVKELFLAALNREPSAKEVKDVLAKMPLSRGKDKDPQTPYEDLLWALLNSNEFVLNH